MRHDYENPHNRPYQARFSMSPTHRFTPGEYVIKVLGDGQIAHFLVDEILSDEKIRVRRILDTGVIEDRVIPVEGRDLKDYKTNVIANRLAKNK